MRYKEQSANVLNEADRFQRQMDWQLFCLEQEMRLFGHDDKIKWVPGDPLYKKWADRVEDNECECPCNAGCFEVGDECCCFCQGTCGRDELEGYYGHHIRPMFQLLVGDDENTQWVRCAPCGVCWEEGDECWVCGVSYPRPKAVEAYTKIMSGGLQWRQNDHNPWQPMGFVTDIETTDRGVMIIGTMTQPGDDWHRRMVEQMALYSQGFQESAQRMREGLQQFSFDIGEVFQADYNFPTHYSFQIPSYNYVNTSMLDLLFGESPTPPPNPFEREEREIELVPPVAADVYGEVAPRGYLRPLPADVDLSGRRPVPMPQMPEPREIPEFRNRSWVALTLDQLMRGRRR